MAEPITWETIRGLCAEAGIAEELEVFEHSLKNVFITTLLGYFGAAKARYLNDHRFRMQVDELVGVLVNAMLQHGVAPRRTSPGDMEALRKIFSEESQQGRGVRGEHAAGIFVDEAAKPDA